MGKRIQNLYYSLISRLILLVGGVLFVIISTWSYFNINYQKKTAMENIVEEVDRLGNTIKLGTHYAMMLNSREDINEIINNIGRQEGIEHVRIFNKQGQIKFSNRSEEIDQTTTIRADACVICHRQDPPLETVDVVERTRISTAPGGYRVMGLITPIYNEPSCSTDCHIHPRDKKVLGALDVVISLESTDQGIRSYKRRIIILAIFSFLATSAIIFAFLLYFVNHPIKKLIRFTRRIGKGDFEGRIGADGSDEIGQLAHAIEEMSRDISRKQEELNRHRSEYQELFEQVPCYITVQDRELSLVRYNREFTRQFQPKPGDRCYEVYKGRTGPCDPCPVLLTFQDGESHSSEETGVARDGSINYWIGRTSPIRDHEGKITAVMEMSLDVTQMRRLEEEIRKSEDKYRYIFNNMPNPVFVLDRKSLRIIDCNDSAKSVYGYDKDELIGTSFLNFFEDGEQQHYALEIRNSDTLNLARQMTRDGRGIYVNIRVSPSEYQGRKAFLVTTSDITKRLMAEQQLIQASKMATLGEMATGIAHELNQPLSVIKTASEFLMRKVRKAEAIREDILKTMAEEINSHVDRASKIIQHLREFGRKSDVQTERVQVNEAIRKALDIFSQQLKLREIEVVQEMQEDLPAILGDANRLEQVFINLLINARDAIEERSEKEGDRNIEKRIFLKTGLQEGKITIEVRDSGVGIPQTILDKIFQPFFTTKRVGKGTGLGLSISYGIVQDYEGTIRVETAENGGAAFIIQFPALGEA